MESLGIRYQFTSASRHSIHGKPYLGIEWYLGIEQWWLGMVEAGSGGMG
jgi:hypothetical protein